MRLGRGVRGRGGRVGGGHGSLAILHVCVQTPTTASSYKVRVKPVDDHSTIIMIRSSGH